MALSAMAVLLLGAGSHSQFAHSQDATSEIVILPSAALHGQLSPCCKKIPLGGLARRGNVLVVRSGDRGQYAARLTLTFNSSGEILDSNGRAEPLNEDMAGDSALVNEITLFEERLAKLPGRRPLERR